MKSIFSREELEQNLKHFDLEVREKSLRQLVEMVNQGEINLPVEKNELNMHCHTFFSFNAYGHSPSSLAWLSKTNGFKVLGIVDFDVLEGVDEFLRACEIVQVKGTAGIETRIYIPEFSELEINSPGEPGVSYHMGIGFTNSTPPNRVLKNLENLTRSSQFRNRTIVDRLNSYLDPICIDYFSEVEVLTPGDNPTERHIVSAYAQKVSTVIDDPAGYWAEKLALPMDHIESIIDDPAKLHNHIRSKLIKKGGPGYISPEPEMFPSVEVFHDLIVGCGALPCLAWLDGTSTGEEDIGRLLELLVSRGVVAVNIIPDRNWNITDPTIKKLKVTKLDEFIRITRDQSLPINVGTEMNSYGQKIVDTFDSPSLLPYWDDFFNGAQFVYGHTVMQRYFNLGYQSEWAAHSMPGRLDRNKFYTQVGSLFPANVEVRKRLEHIHQKMNPSEIIAEIKQQVVKVN